MSGFCEGGVFSMFPEVTKAGDSSSHLQLYKTGIVLPKLPLFYEFQLSETPFLLLNAKLQEREGAEGGGKCYSEV